MAGRIASEPSARAGGGAPGQVGAEDVVEAVGVDVTVEAEVTCCVIGAELEGERELASGEYGEGAEGGLALVEGEGGDVDESLDVGGLCGGVGDDRSPVGMTHE